MLSVDSLPKTSVVTYDHADMCHTIAIDCKIYDYKVPYGKKGLPVRRFPYVNQPNVSHTLVNTVAQNESVYTKREVEENLYSERTLQNVGIPILQRHLGSYNKRYPY